MGRVHVNHLQAAGHPSRVRQACRLDFAGGQSLRDKQPQPITTVQLIAQRHQRYEYVGLTLRATAMRAASTLSRLTYALPARYQTRRDSGSGMPIRWAILIIGDITQHVTLVSPLVPLLRILVISPFAFIRSAGRTQQHRYVSQLPPASVRLLNGEIFFP
ncbi:Uncharacterised protein [Salmonella enterica subsp. enterica]|uniref:Uncharacterized protein n=1 Tax=Salmonella enterica I TaxID=59201 RepID=A0A379X270_SALET|nr:Uncharacterised protein [Salmonella enterica subsp. enterica]